MKHCAQHPMYSLEPTNRKRYTKEFDQAYTRYTRYAGLYDLIVKLIPVWRNWISQAIPAIRGPRVLEISFGTGYLLKEYADRYDLNYAQIHFASVAAFVAGWRSS